MASARLKWMRTKRWINRWRQITSDDSVAVLFDGSARIQYLLFVVIGFFILPSKGQDLWLAHFMNAWNALAPFGLAFALFVFFNAIGAIFKTNKQLKELGVWSGNSFIYHAPLHVWTGSITDKDNDRIQVFKIPDAENGVMISPRIVFQNPSSSVKAYVCWPNGGPMTMDWAHIKASNDLEIALKLPPDRLLGIRTHAAPNSMPSTLRVYVSSWQLDGL